jgi:hypothetical protein
MNAEECKKYGFVDEIIGEKLPVEEVEVKDGELIQVNGVPLKVRFKESAKKEYKNKPNKQKQKQKQKE